MSNSPVPLQPIASGYLAVPAKELHIVSQYLKAHEKPIIAAMVLLTTIGFYSKVVNWLYEHDKVKAAEADTIAKAQATQNAIVANQNAALEAQYQLMVAQLDATRKALTAAQTKRDADTKKQQVADQTLPLTALPARWATLLGNEGYFGGKVGYEGDSTGRTYLDETGARQSLQMLEEVPQLKGDLKDEKAIVASDATQIAGLGSLNTGLHTQIDGLNSQITKDNAACEADKTLIKAEARKSKLKWAVGGFIAGFLLRSFIHPAGAVSPTAIGNVSIPAL